MKLLLIGNHTCGNRGDGAILRGLLQRMVTLIPQADITITSRYPVSSSYLLGHPMVADPLFAWRKAHLNSRIKQMLAKYLLPGLMMLAVRSGWRWPVRLLPRLFQREIDALAQYDAVIHVGGSVFVDLYGYGQFDYPFLVMLANKPLLLFGHSLGPFEGKFYAKLAATLLEHSNEVVLRETVSLEMLERSALPTQHVTKGGDTAWLVSPEVGQVFKYDWFEQRTEPRPVVAITMRELVPFDKRLNITQQAYEEALARVVDRIVDAGYDVLAVSTCTGIDSYHRDDRMNALRIGRLLRKPNHYHVVMDELNDVQLGLLLKRCVLLVGTRLHSAIIGMNFGTPAITINYEHKSEGVMRQLGLSALSQPVSAVLDGSLAALTLDVLSRLDHVKAQVREAVDNERTRTMDKLVDSLQRIDLIGAPSEYQQRSIA